MFVSDVSVTQGAILVFRWASSFRLNRSGTYSPLDVVGFGSAVH